MNFFITSHIGDVLSECMVIDKSVMNTCILLLQTLLAELFCCMELLSTFCFSVPAAVWPILPDVEVLDRDKVKNGLDIRLVHRRVLA